MDDRTLFMLINLSTSFEEADENFNKSKYHSIFDRIEFLKKYFVVYEKNDLYTYDDYKFILTNVVGSNWR